MTPPTYTPLSRAGFEAIGIKQTECFPCEGTGVWNHRHGFSRCYTCDHRGMTGPDITGVLANDPPAQDQEQVEAAVEWLGLTKVVLSPGCQMCQPDSGIFTGCECHYIDVTTRLLVVAPGAAIDLYHVLGALAEQRGTHAISGLIIVGGDTPLNPAHVAHLIEQAESAGVPVWLDWGVWMPRQEWENNPEIVLPDDYAVDRVRDDPDMVHIDADFGYHVMHRVKREEFLMPGTLENKVYRQLPASMGGV